MKKNIKQNLRSILFFLLSLNIFGCPETQKEALDHSSILNVVILGGSSHEAGTITIRVYYKLASDAEGKNIWVAYSKSDGSVNGVGVYLTIEGWGIEGDEDFDINITQSGDYNIIAYIGTYPSTTNQIAEKKCSSLLTVTGGTISKLDKFIAEANNYMNYSIHWYNRKGHVLTDQNGDLAIHEFGIPYSLTNFNSTNLGKSGAKTLTQVISDINAWKVSNQTHWYQYQPGKIGYNLYDVVHSSDTGYPWPTSYTQWTGLVCYTYVYNCAKTADYNFTSDGGYNNADNWTSKWETIGTSVAWNETRRGDIVVFKVNGDVWHVGIVYNPALKEVDIEHIGVLGVYTSPFNYKVSRGTILNFKTAMQDPNEPENSYTFIYRRLPND